MRRLVMLFFFFFFVFAKSLLFLVALGSVTLLPLEQVVVLHVVRPTN
jgi:hypothetical protein